MSAPATMLPKAPAMRLPRVRFNVRGMIVGVAIVALVLGWLGNRRSRFLRMAAYYRNVETPAISSTTAWHRISWKVLHRRKYERAARYPWLPTSSDEPMPPEVDDPPDF